MLLRRYHVDATGPSPQVGDGLERPDTTAKKPVWVEFADSLGLDTDGTKDDLIARVNEALGDTTTPDTEDTPKG